MSWKNKQILRDISYLEQCSSSGSSVPLFYTLIMHNLQYDKLMGKLPCGRHVAALL
jgi:hypothetical protein